MNDNNQNYLTRQEKKELLSKYIGKDSCFLCHWALTIRKEERELLSQIYEQGKYKNPLPLCLKCYNRYQILRDLEEKCECGCEKCQCHKINNITN